MHRILPFVLALLCLCQGRRLKASDELQAVLTDASTELEDSPANPSADVSICVDKLARFDSLDDQDLSDSVGNDPFFPPELSSIAAPGTKCGDAAQHVSSSCEKFNNWKPFQRLSRHRQLKVIGEAGISFRHIEQGQLGNCYFLAGLAAIAVNHPEIIDKMFVDKDLWASNIFKTKWLLFGKKQTIVVDNMLPASSHSAYFTRPSREGEFWPVILAKSWAKMFGNFHAVESGDAREVIKAVTRAPGEYIVIKKNHTEDSLWQMMREAVLNKYPISAGTTPGEAARKYKLAEGHAYAVLDVFVLPPYGQVVKLYNPWNRNNYVGKVQNNEAINGRKNGVFTMTSSEFYEGFNDLSVNYVTASHKVTSIPMSVGSLNGAEVTVSQPGKFWVSIAWPSKRMVQPCEPLKPKSILKAESTSAKGQIVGKTLESTSGQNDVTIEIENPEGGVYNILAGVSFQDNTEWMDEVALTVYAPGKPEIQEAAGDVTEIALGIVGPARDGKACQIAAFADQGTFVADASKPNSNGIPTFWSVDKKNFVYYVNSEDQWYAVSEKYYPQIRKGEMWSSSKHSKSDFTCGCHDAPDGVKGFSAQLPCEKFANGRGPFSNVKCFGAEYSELVQRYCPATCNVCTQLIPTTTTTTMLTTTTTTMTVFRAAPISPEIMEPETTTTTTIERSPPNLPRPQPRQKILEPIIIEGIVEKPTTTTTTTTKGADALVLDVPLFPGQPVQCKHVSGGTDRNGFTWGQGSCQCREGYVLGRGCTIGHLLAPGRRFFSKSTLQTLRIAQLARCRCERE